MSPIIAESFLNSPTAHKASVLRGAVGQPPGPLLVLKGQKDSLMPDGTWSRDGKKECQMAPSLHHPSPKDTSAPKTLSVTVMVPRDTPLVTVSGTQQHPTCDSHGAQGHPTCDSQWYPGTHTPVTGTPYL